MSGECDHAKAAREIARTTPLSLDAATALIDSLARGSSTLADAWDEGYGAAETKARMWGHADHWETGPENPYRLTVADEGPMCPVTGHRGCACVSDGPVPTVADEGRAEA